MPSPHNPRVYPEVVPQVGAILYLDTALDPPQVERGNRHWLLSGSCVLIAPDRILTIGHALTRLGRHAAFFPFEGIVPLLERPLRQFRYGDSVVLGRLTRKLKHVAPLPHWKVVKDSLRREEVLVGGFGDWKGIAGAETDGMQRLVRVELGLPGFEEGNLDISWWSQRNDGIEALLDNSGGPLLKDGLLGRTRSFGVVGITRERRSRRQVCSWITGDRDQWLRRLIGWPRWPRPPQEPVKTYVRNLIVSGKGHVERVPLPPIGASRVQATLSATGGMRLQMAIRPAPEPSDLLETLATDNRTSGRFLVRDMELDEQTQGVAIGIVPVGQAPARTDKVQAQLCCMFL